MLDLFTFLRGTPDPLFGLRGSVHCPFSILFIIGDHVTALRFFIPFILLFIVAAIR